MSMETFAKGMEEHMLLIRELREEGKHALYKKLMKEKEKEHYQFLKSKYWKNEIRLKIFQHDNYTCVICGEAYASKVHVHHITEFSADDELTPRNLVTLCNTCSRLHPLFSLGLWNLGWPDLKKVRVELKDFYDKVKAKIIIQNTKKRLIDSSCGVL